MLLPLNVLFCLLRHRAQMLVIDSYSWAAACPR